MKQNTLQQILLYRYRYILGYGLFTFVLIALLSLELTQVPFGITTSEIQSTLSSSSLKISRDTSVIDLPYHLLQKASIGLLGLSVFSIKLPSVIIAIAGGIGLLMLLRRWFKENVAIISSLIAISSSIFLIAGRSGTPDIMILFWAVYILLFATLITQEAQHQFMWKLLFGLSVGLSLYSPLSIYILGASLLAGLLHPHVRYLIKNFGGPELVATLFLFIVSIVPLLLGIWQSPSIIGQLIGIPATIPNVNEYLHNLSDVVMYLAGITAPQITEVIQPAFNVAVLVLILLGILRTIADHHSTRTYALLIWGAILIPVIAFNPRYSVALYIPAVLFMAIGVQTLIREWYTLFPRNPYARLAGLLPLVVLIGGIWYYNYTTYFMGYRYSSNSAAIFNEDLPVLRKSLTDSTKPVVIVPRDQVAFYSLLNPKFGDKKVTITTADQAPSAKGEIIVAKEVYTPSLGQIKGFLISPNKEDNLRWYIIDR